MRFVIYVSGKAGSLERLLSASSPLLDQTAAVVSDGTLSRQIQSDLIERGIALHRVDYAALGLKGKSRNTYLSTELLHVLEDSASDYLFSFGDKIICGPILDKYRLRMINFHPSILPMFRGQKAIDQARKSGAFLLGNTAHFIDEGTDTGPIIMQSVVSAAACSSYDDVLNAQVQMVNQIVKWLDCGELTCHDGIPSLKRRIQPEHAFFPSLDK